jgi:tight adherence protein B
MFFGQSLTELALIAAVVVLVGCIFLAIFYPYLVGDRSRDRLKGVAGGGRESKDSSTSFWRKQDDNKDGRRKNIQDALKQVETTEKAKARKKMTLKSRIAQAGLDMSMNKFWVISAVTGLVLTVGGFVAGLPPLSLPLVFIIGLLGLPRWVVGYLARKRQTKFLNDFADGIDIMVRGLKSGLPVAETIKIIASELSDPVGPEFAEVVDGQRVGISIDQGIERMADRVPLAEVGFLAIVMSIQSKTGGNLSEALSNLSRVLRDRKKMKAKIRSVSQEAKSSATIIGSLPILMIGGIYLMAPDYMVLMFTTKIGNIALAVSGVWMMIGMATMKKMINFDI